jgi:hypothetical protein
MSNAKHTPGPWKPHHIKEHFSGTPELFQIHWSDDGECVSEIVHGAANAHLISAAPELLEALKLVATAFYSNADLVTKSNDFGYSIEQVEAIESARAAIAKATGSKAAESVMYVSNGNGACVPVYTKGDGE